ncbi:MAG: glycosyltransferase [Pyrinomonadaceae bacterium]|nr:glycosyltransferase [Pyrinomonadaceae bacterium]
MSEQTECTISVVVPVYNGGKTIRATIEHLLSQSLPPDEIIVVDDGSTDETANVLKSFGDRIKVLSKTKGGPASARNLGVRSSIGTLIAFTDSDCFPDENWLQEIVKGFQSLSIVGVGGTVCGASEGLIGEYVDLHGWMNPQCASDGNVLYLVTANACVRSDVLFRANLFDERFQKAGGEDTELSVRLRNFGYEFAFVESAIVRHRHKQTIRDYLKNIANHGEGQFILERLWPQQIWKANHRKEIVRSRAGVGTMLRFYLSYRQQHDRKRALFFSLLDHCQYIARIWGYRRGKRNVSSSSLRNPLTRDPVSAVYPSEHLRADAILCRRSDAGV